VSDQSDGEIEHGSTEYWRREAEESDSHEWCEDCESSYFAHFDSCPHCERRVATDGGRDQCGDELPRETDFVHTTPAVTLRLAVVDEMESRVGDVRLEAFEGYGRDLRIVIALSEKELAVAEYSGLLIEHPLRDKLIMLAPWDHGQHVDDVFGCVATKHTRPRLESGSLVEYTHEESRNTAFELKGAANAA